MGQQESSPAFKKSSDKQWHQKQEQKGTEEHLKNHQKMGKKTFRINRRKGANIGHGSGGRAFKNWREQGRWILASWSWEYRQEGGMRQ